MDEFEQIRIKVTEKIGEVEQAVESLQSLRKNLLQKAYETKQSILSAFINQRDSMQSREMVLLGQVDSLLHSKDDALVTQLSKLNQVLGCLRNCLQSDHPCGDCLEKFDDLDLDPVTDMSIEFSSANDMLKNAIHCYGQLSGQMTDSTTHEDTDSSSITKWLLTPTNVELKDSKTNTTKNEIVTTEWLLEHHSMSPSSSNGVGAGTLFTEVKSADRECWLRADAPATSSLYSYVLKHFTRIKEEPHHDWLLQDTAETRSLCSESVSEWVTSSASSCVIIPSATTSECSSSSSSGGGSGYCVPNLWLKNEFLPPTNGQSYGVNSWVATCKPENDSTWLTPTRGRLVSMSSLASEVNQLELDGEKDSEWLLPRAENCSLLSPAPSHCQQDEWLTSTDNKWLSYNKPPSTLPEWLPIPKKLDLPDFDFTQEEKHDEMAEKTDNVDDAWLMKGTGQDWRLGSSSTFKPSQKNLPPLLKKHIDKDWLVVVNTLNRIASSQHSDWLVNATPAS